MTKINLSSTVRIVPLVFLLCNCIHNVDALGRTISDLRIQDHDITPVLGRGYSVATGGLQSSCLGVVERTKPSYDFISFFTEFKGDSEIDRKSAWSGTIKYTKSYWWSRKTIEGSYSVTGSSNTKKKQHHIIFTMKTERYYSSVDEITAELSDSALSLLESGQYISFFQACGPNYIRGIRRAAELSAIFSYESTNSRFNYKTDSDIKSAVSGWWRPTTNNKSSSSSKIDSNAMRSSLTINIRGFGLALNEEGADSMIATSMEDVKKVMDFAFQSMQTIGTGMVQGIEIVPWVDNPQFQVAAGLGDILQKCDDGDDDEENDDKDEGEETTCTVVSTEMKKMSLSTNGEYVATMNHVLRKKIDILHDMQQCRTMLHEFTDDDLQAFLINHKKDDGYVSNGKHVSGMTVETMKEMINVDNLNTVRKDMQNYVKHFYEPCIAALTEEYGGLTGGTAQVKPWFTLDKCQDMACTVSGVSISEEGKCTLPDPDMWTLNVEQYCMPILEGSM